MFDKILGLLIFCWLALIFTLISTYESVSNLYAPVMNFITFLSIIITIYQYLTSKKLNFIRSSGRLLFFSRN